MEKVDVVHEKPAAWTDEVDDPRENCMPVRELERQARASWTEIEKSEQRLT
jgi:hypothetical protein